ncbi:ABC transporter ATP-binding protein [Arthrobacter ginkgonis]|uniref:ABC transporter ATP-binding protein n=1 Tax=Arthrobacter ginkgonis TaxID=1630594 RepID=A0ABP7C9D9_9MICC
MGESGSGKSVSLLAATGLLGHNAGITGKALFQGRDLVGLGRQELRKIRGRDIGFVFQEPLTSLHPLKRVGEQVGEAIRSHRRLPRKQLRERVVELLTEVGIKDAEQRVDDYPSQFSGGMRQRVMIASAIALNPAVLIADEPTTALDATVQASILDLLKKLQENHNTAIILVSHDLGVVADIADDVVVMKSGRVVESGTADQIYGNPQHPYTVELLGAASHRVSKDAAPVAAGSPELLRVRGVHKGFATRRAGRKSTRKVLDDVTLSIRRGEIVGLVGESGSGKSTLGRLVAGLLRVDEGSVAIGGEEYNAPGKGGLHLPPALRRQVQVVFQDPFGSLNPRRRIGAVLAEPLVLHRRGTEGEIHLRVADLLDKVGLDESFASRFPAELSGGQRQRVAIARAIALDPALVVADEPVSALDITTQVQIVDLIRDLRRESGISFLFISHDLGVVADLCDRVEVISDGRLVEGGITSEVFTNPQHPYTQELLASVPGRRRSLVRFEPAAGVPEAAQEVVSA